MITELTPRQRTFTNLYLSGLPAGRAYEQAGYKSTGDAAYSCAHKLLRNAEIQHHLKTMSEKTESNLILTIKERKQMLTRIARNNVGDSPQVTIRAIAELNKMDGAYAAKQIEHKVDNFFENVPTTNGLGGR